MRKKSVSSDSTTKAEISVDRLTGRVITRRGFIQTASAVTAGTILTQRHLAAEMAHSGTENMVSMNLTINGQKHQLSLDSRTTLLDALREHLDLTGAKKGCDHGQCGACTVLCNDRRVNSCLMLAASAQGDEITTIEGLAKGDELHPVQQAFVDCDGFQCGYCTPGQICSAVALLEEAKQDQLSSVSFATGQLHSPPLADEEIRERMSGNICRCGAYPNIVAAVRLAAGGKQ